MIFQPLNDLTDSFFFAGERTTFLRASGFWRSLVVHSTTSESLVCLDDKMYGGFMALGYSEREEDYFSCQLHLKNQTRAAAQECSAKWAKS